MKTNSPSRLGRTALLVGAGLGCLAGALPAAEKKEPPLENYLEVSSGYTLQDGDRAGFQKARQYHKEGFGGIEDLFYTKELDDRTTLKLRGRALAGNGDYLFDLAVHREDVGFLKLGYRQFRVWYDGSGGYFPAGGFIRQLYDEDLHLDRGNLWFEAGYTPADGIDLDFRYDLFTRKGKKDSLSWGDTGLAAGAANVKGLLPSFWKIDEKRHQLSASAAKTTDKNAWELGVRYDKGDYTNTRNVRRRAGEAGFDRKVTQKEGQDYDLFQVRGSYEARIHEQLVVTTAVARTTIDTTLSGSRIYGQDYDPIYDAAFLNRQQRDEGFFGAHGESEMRQTVANLSARYQATETLVVVPAVRFEKIDWSNQVEFEETNFGAGPAFAPVNDEVEADSEKEWKVVAGSLEARYTGKKNVSLNFKAEWTKSDGELSEERIVEPGTALQSITIDRDTDFKRTTQKYAATANWYARPGTTVAVQYYYKVRTNDYRSTRDNTVSSADRYPAYVANQDFETNDWNVRLSTRLAKNLRSVTRYDYQQSTIRTQDVGLAMGESAEMTTHILAETLTWSPRNHWYLQGGVNLVWDTLRTPAVTLTGAAAGLVKNSDANYTSFTLGSGYALDDQSDLYVDYTLTESRDSYVDNSARSVPYGSDARTQLASVTWTRKLDRRTSLTLKYAYGKNEDVPSGGNADYEAHLLYGKIQYRF
ncbi:MAG: hypothetical protein JNG83_05740 [Opitutaceae bacterium]|nr:hypothetical protein [Opitutaceae bacterium]